MITPSTAAVQADPDGARRLARLTAGPIASAVVGYLAGVEMVVARSRRTGEGRIAPPPHPRFSEVVEGFEPARPTSR